MASDFCGLHMHEGGVYITVVNESIRRVCVENESSIPTPNHGNNVLPTSRTLSEIYSVWSMLERRPTSMGLCTSIHRPVGQAQTLGPRSAICGYIFVKRQPVCSFPTLAFRTI